MLSLDVEKLATPRKAEWLVMFASARTFAALPAFSLAKKYTPKQKLKFAGIKQSVCLKSFE